MLAASLTSAIIKLMCEFNRPYPVPFGQHPDDFHHHPTSRVLPHEAWVQREAALPEDEVAAIRRAVEEAAAADADVHLRRDMGTRALIISLEPGPGPNVRIFEH